MNLLLIAVVMLFGTSLAGVLGTLLALPVAGAVQVLLLDVLERRRQKWQRDEQLVTSDLSYAGGMRRRKTDLAETGHQA